MTLYIPVQKGGIELTPEYFAQDRSLWGGAPALRDKVKVTPDSVRFFLGDGCGYVMEGLHRGIKVYFATHPSKTTTCEDKSNSYNESGCSRDLTVQSRPVKSLSQKWDVNDTAKTIYLTDRTNDNMYIVVIPGQEDGKQFNISSLANCWSGPFSGLSASQIRDKLALYDAYNKPVAGTGTPGTLGFIMPEGFKSRIAGIYIDSTLREEANRGHRDIHLPKPHLLDTPREHLEQRLSGLRVYINGGWRDLKKFYTRQKVKKSWVPTLDIYGAILGPNGEVVNPLRLGYKFNKTLPNGSALVRVHSFAQSTKNSFIDISVSSANIELQKPLEQIVTREAAKGLKQWTGDRWQELEITESQDAIPYEAQVHGPLSGEVRHRLVTPKTPEEMRNAVRLRQYTLQNTHLSALIPGNMLGRLVSIAFPVVNEFQAEWTGTEKEI